MDVASSLASLSAGGAYVPWFVSLAAEPLLLIQELHPGLNISALPPPPVPISLRSGSSLQKRACSNGSNGSNSNGNSNNNSNNNNSNNNSNGNNNNSNSKSGGTSLVGPVVGAVVGTLALAVFAFFIYRGVQRRKAAKAAAAAAATTTTGNPPANITPFPGPPAQTYTPPPMKETGSYFGPGGMPNAYQVNMNVNNSTGAPSTYSGASDHMSYYNAGGQTPGNAYFNQMPSPMPPQMPTMPQNPSFNSPAPSPWNVNMGAPPVHPGQSPSPGVSYPSSTPAPSATPAPTFTMESSGISSTSTPPPMSPSVAGSTYAPWANPSAQAGSSSSSNAPVAMAGFMTAQQEKAQFSGAFPVSEKSQFSGVSTPGVASAYAGGSGSGKSDEPAAKSAPAPAPASNQERNSAANEEEDAVPVGLPPPAYTFTAQ